MALAAARSVADLRQPGACSGHRRRRIWEFSTNLHCSIIGTCLSTAELRQVLDKIGGGDAVTASEHDVHARGVVTAGKPREGARLLHKALDRRHRIAINRFNRVKTAEEVRALWQECLQRGEVPGAYWAALTHPASDDLLVREIFADVHMLSHLVGAANRADIRRLRQLEAENADLRGKAERQQQQLRDAIITRDATIRELSRALEQRLASCPQADLATPHDPALVTLVADLEGRLTRAQERRERAARKLDDARIALGEERRARLAAERSAAERRRELEAIEEHLAAEPPGAATHAVAQPGATLLYVGGRPAGIGRLRAAAARAGADFLHHDGGVEEREGLLPGLVSRADAVMFPVDCISHAAMALVKRLCRQSGKPFIPLRSTGLAPFCAALRQPMLTLAEE